MRKLLRIFFHHFYHRFSWTYDFVAAVVSVGRWKNWIRTTLPHIRGTKILEIGFGPGHLQVELNRLGFQALGLDESPQMASRARKNLLQNGFPSALTRGDAQFLPFAPNSFDSVVATFPSEYITESLTLAEIHRLLKPAGRLVIVPTAWIDGRSLADFAARWLFRITGQAAVLTNNLTDRIASIFSDSGFRVEMFRAEVSQSTVLIVVAEKTG